MPVVINEVIVRAIISGDENRSATETAEQISSQNEDGSNKAELLELIDEVINEKKER